MFEAAQEIHALIKKTTSLELDPSDWSLPPHKKLGDIAIPCFRLSKELKKSPADVAKELSESLNPRETTLIDSFSVAGPYLNAWIKTDRYFSVLWNEVKGEDLSQFGGSGCGQGKSIAFDFSSPNIAKEMALHHLRSTAIGHSLSRIVELHSHRSIKINYLGDWGTTHGKLIYALKNFGDESLLKSQGVKYMLELYVEFNKREKKEPTLSGEAKKIFAKLEQGDTEYRRIWSLLRELSIEEFKKLYSRLGIEFDFYDGESLYEGKMDPVVEEINKKIGTRISDGALICELPGHKIPALLKKDDGASLYLTRDLAALEDRWDRFQFEQMLYVVGQQQKLHFEQLFKIVELLGKKYSGRMKHVAFGMLSLGNKTMASREGNVIFLTDVLDEARERAKKLILEKSPELENLDQTAEDIGLAAILFSDLSQNRKKDVKFDWDAALSFEGDTGPFIQYTHARCCSLADRVESKLKELGSLANSEAFEEKDFEKLQNLSQAPALKEVIKEWALFKNFSLRAYKDLDPSQIGHSLLQIAHAFNHLYHQIRFLDREDPTELKFLLSLTRGTHRLLQHGLSLLGIKAPTRM